MQISSAQATAMRVPNLPSNLFDKLATLPSDPSITKQVETRALSLSSSVFDVTRERAETSEPRQSQQSTESCNLTG